MMPYSGNPQLIVIEVPGIQEWSERLAETMFFDIPLEHLIQFLLASFKHQTNALMNLDYDLMDAYGYQFQENTGLEGGVICNEIRKLAIDFLRQLQNISVWRNNSLDYCFAKSIATDTFLLWKPSRELI